MPTVLFIRADGSSNQGTGHVMRCLALAQAWMRAGGQVVWAQVETTSALTARLHAEGISRLELAVAAGSLEDASWTASQARAAGADWIVADGYRFDARWQKQIHDAGLRLLVIDDYGHATHYYADLILNQNASAHAALYERREQKTRLLLGPRYALLRNEFLTAPLAPRVIPPVARKILVTLGGSDSENVTVRVIEALARLPGIEGVVVAGGSNPNLAAIKAAIGASSSNLRLVVDATNMPELMAWAEVAISAAGSTSWELAYMGLPSILIVTAQNQAAVAEKLGRENVSMNLGWHASLSAERIAASLRVLLADAVQRQAMSDRGRQWVDRRGAARVVTYLKAVRLKLRNATGQDARLVWQWANEPEVRASAFNSDPIAWDSHLAWFDAKLRAKNTALFIASSDSADAPCGQVRFDWDESGIAEVDVSVDRRLRKTGLGSAVLRTAVETLFATAPVRSVRALVKPGNQASIAAFENADFQRAGSVSVHGSSAVQLVLEKRA